MVKYNDYPFAEITKRAEQLIAQGMTLYQKWSCDKCGQRQGMPTPNHFYETGKCDQCGHVTDIKARGCNYMAVLGDPAAIPVLPGDRRVN